MIPTWEQYKEENPSATWSTYVSRFAAMAAEAQVKAGEIPSEYGTGYSFTSQGVWVPSGSPAAIGGLPGEIQAIFPGVQDIYQTASQTAREGSVVSSSPVAEPQTSFLNLPYQESLPALLPTNGGGTAPIQFNQLGSGPQLGVGAPIGSIGSTFTMASNGNGGGGNGEGAGGMGLLVLLALALGMGGL